MWLIEQRSSIRTMATHMSIKRLNKIQWLIILLFLGAQISVSFTSLLTEVLSGGSANRPVMIFFPMHSESLQYMQVSPTSQRRIVFLPLMQSGVSQYTEGRFSTTGAKGWQSTGNLFAHEQLDVGLYREQFHLTYVEPFNITSDLIRADIIDDSQFVTRPFRFQYNSLGNISTYNWRVKSETIRGWMGTSDDHTEIRTILIRDQESMIGSLAQIAFYARDFDPRIGTWNYDAISSMEANGDVGNGILLSSEIHANYRYTTYGLDLDSPFAASDAGAWYINQSPLTGAKRDHLYIMFLLCFYYTPVTEQTFGVGLHTQAIISFPQLFLYLLFQYLPQHLYSPAIARMRGLQHVAHREVSQFALHQSGHRGVAADAPGDWLCALCGALAQGRWTVMRG